MSDGTLRNYSIGAGGVNVDADPLEMDDSELRVAQNAIRDPLSGGGITKRPGLLEFGNDLGSRVLGGIGVPLQDLSVTGTHFFFIGRA